MTPDTAAVTPDSAAVRIIRTDFDAVVDDRTFGLPRLDGTEGPPDFRVEGVLGDGEGRAWLRVCRPSGCAEPERWVVLEPAPARRAERPPELSGIVLPSGFRLEAVRGSRLYGVQGPPGRQELHVMEMRETNRRRR